MIVNLNARHRRPSLAWRIATRLGGVPFAVVIVFWAVLDTVAGLVAAFVWVQVIS